MGTTATPHDAVFKKYLTRKTTAEDFLKIYLPPELLQQCDMRSLAIESGSFIEEDLRAYYADILYSMQTLSGKGYIYVVIEHQSSPEKNMPLRLLRYALEAMQQHLEKGNKSLPLVIPVLFYHGKATPYPYSMNWLHGFSDPQLAQDIYTSSFPLADITVLDDDKIEKHRGIAMLEMMQKHIRERDLMVIAEKLGRLMAKGYNSQEQLRASINYLLEAGETATPLLFVQTLIQYSPEHEELLMTIAEQLRQEGIALGELRGIQKTLRQVAQTMLNSGMDPLTVMKITGLAEDELKQLCH